MKYFLASHPRGLPLADFPNSFRSVFRASVVVRVVTAVGRLSPEAHNGEPSSRFCQHYCEVIRR